MSAQAHQAKIKNLTQLAADELDENWGFDPQDMPACPKEVIEQQIADLQEQIAEKNKEREQALDDLEFSDQYSEEPIKERIKTIKDELKLLQNELKKFQKDLSQCRTPLSTVASEPRQLKTTFTTSAEAQARAPAVAPRPSLLARITILFGMKTQGHPTSTHPAADAADAADSDL